jgi:hypothetical protein
MSWDDVGPNHCHMDGTPIVRVISREKNRMINDDDFGFSIVDEKDIISTDTKAQQLHDMIMPLLKNLKANPDKDIIKWNGADRVKRIDDFIRKMNNVLNS